MTTAFLLPLRNFTGVKKYEIWPRVSTPVDSEALVSKGSKESEI